MRLDEKEGLEREVRESFERDPQKLKRVINNCFKCSSSEDSSKKDRAEDYLGVIGDTLLDIYKEENDVGRCKDVDVHYDGVNGLLGIRVVYPDEGIMIYDGVSHDVVYEREFRNGFDKRSYSEVESALYPSQEGYRTQEMRQKVPPSGSDVH